MSQQLRGRHRNNLTVPLVEASWKRKKLWDYGFKRTRLPFPQSPIGKLPRELRDQIYKHYLTIPGGFVIHRNWVNNALAYELRTATGEPLDHALRRVCKDIAYETEQLVFECNSISSVTHAPKNQSEQEMAYHWGIVTHNTDLYVLQMVCNSLKSFSSNRQQMINRVLYEFPQYRGVLEDIIEGKMSHDNLFPPVTGEAITAERKFLIQAFTVLGLPLEFICQPPIVPGEQRWRRTCDTTINHACWEIPASCNSMFHHSSFSSERESRFSAAAVMIDFLRGIENNTLARVRTLDIHEDRQSVAFPECHVQGLIEFYRKNPNLRINRRVNVWQALAPVGELDFPIDFRRGPRLDRLHLPLRHWMSEANELKEAMPAEAFTLTLYCNSLPNRIKQVFDIIQLQAAWEIARYEAYKQDVRANSVSIHLRRMRDPHGILKQGLEDIANGKSYVKCKFHVGSPVDPKSLLEHGRWSPTKWKNHCQDLGALRAGSHTI